MMIWLYWRRSRLVIGVAGLALGTLAALIMIAGAVADAGKRPGSATPAAMRRAGEAQRSVTPPSAADPQVHRGLVLMAAAVTACRTVSYRGVQIVAWSSPEGSSSYLLDVWHRSGEPELAEGDGDVDDPGSPAETPGSAAGSGGAVGVLSISEGMLDLLRVNYVIEYAGPGSSSNRPAQIVAVRRHDGTLAARYWLDRQTGLPLRREMFDQSGHRISEGAFIDLELGENGMGLAPPVQGQAWSTYVPLSQRMAPKSRPTAARLTALHADGWPVPSRLAGNMVLAGVTRTAAPSGPVVDASYSDGLSVVSVFMQHGELSGTLPGWHEERVGGLPVYSTVPGQLAEEGLAWSAHGVVFTVIADAPPEAVTEVVAQLPHERHAGFWTRVVRGLKRIGSWFDPFG
ncbi:MAG TPA: sigma-E factor regulatory protein RseB domain-containing protein [Streptosporangiaceae bacterium]|nr:sigma-E factor regulatory protein RseB domain-containing protein [Streptosporangiaceae bacterium]